MERKNSFVVNGGIKLPIGYRFHPTDEELVVHYLKRKAFGLPLPVLVIREFDVFKFHPESFPGDVKEKKRYFFSSKKGICFGTHRSKRPVCCGYWKPVGKERQIIASTSKQTVGIRRTLVFYETNKHSKCYKTRWIMKEYCLVGFPATNQICGLGMEEEWAVYNVFQRKKKAINRKKIAINRKKIAVNEDYIGPTTIDFTIETDKPDMGPPPPSPPTSSEDLSNGLTDQDEITTF